jgi:hypothetical protein
MSEIDRERIEGVRTLRRLGYVFREGQWVDPEQPKADFAAEADAMHRLLVARTDQPQGCVQGSVEEAELAGLGGAIDAYEAKRWPEGRATGGKG